MDSIKDGVSRTHPDGINLLVPYTMTREGKFIQELID